MLNAVKFLLDHIIKHGDAHAAAQAARHKQILEEENSDLDGIVGSLPHDGGQSPQPATADGLGGTDEATPQGNDQQQTD